MWSHFHVHRIEGDAAQMVFYDYDFLPETAELNRYGRKRVEKVIALLPQSFSPVLVEPVEGRPHLSESRRMAVVQMLATGPFPVPAERVRLAWPLSPALPGDEARLLHQKHLQDIESGGGLQSSYGGGIVLPADGTLDPSQ